MLAVSDQLAWRARHIVDIRLAEELWIELHCADLPSLETSKMSVQAREAARAVDDEKLAVHV
jgi:hypothetical protein